MKLVQTTFVVGVMMITVICGCKPSSSHQDEAPTDGQIVQLSRGSEKVLEPAPSAVVLFFKNETHSKPFCHGTFVSFIWILTAGHCVEGKAKENLEIGAGSNDLLDSVKLMKIRVKDVVMHPDYIKIETKDKPPKLKTLKNDLALLKIFPEDIVRKDDVGISRVSSIDVIRRQGTKLFVGSWGPVDGSPSSRFQTDYRKIFATMRPALHCPQETFDHIKMFCAGTKNVTVCPGDSGSAASLATSGLRSPLLVGIVSFGPKGCTGPAAYTRVNMYQDWITKITAPPEMLLVQSKGPAGETHGDMMGIYELLPSSHNNKPVWEQDKKKWKLFYTKDGYWMIGYIETELGGVKSAVTGSSLPTEVKSWEHSDWDGRGWTEDRQLSVSEGPLPVFPNSVFITGDGPAASEHPDCFGHFVKHGSQFRRPIWKHNSNSIYLFFNSNGRWVVSDDPSKTTAWLQSSRGGEITPFGLWRYADGHGGWTSDPSIKVAA